MNFEFPGAENGSWASKPLRIKGLKSEKTQKSGDRHQQVILVVFVLPSLPEHIHAALER